MALWLSIGKCRGEMMKNVLLRGSQIVAHRPFCTGVGETKANKTIVWKESDNTGVRIFHPVYAVIDSLFNTYTDYAFLKSIIDQYYKPDPKRQLQYDYADYKLYKFVQEEKLVPPPDKLEQQLQEIKEGDAKQNETPQRYAMQTFLDPSNPDFTHIAKRAIDSYNLSQDQEESKIQLVDVRSAYTHFDLDETKLVIEAKPRNASDDQPATYECYISANDEKLVEPTPLNPACN